MDHLRGEDIHDLRQHILDKLIHLLVTHTEHILIHAPVVAHLIRTTRTSQFRITGEGCQHVSWHIDLWHHGDMTGSGIGHDLTSLSLRIITTIRCLVVDIRIGADDGTCALRTHRHKFRPFLDLDAPALIICEMPVEHIHIVHGQQVEELLHELDAEEMTRAVEMHATPREPRTVGDHYGIHDRTLTHGLTQCLDTIEHTSRRTTLNGDTTLTDSHHISLFLLDLRRDGEFDIAHLLGTLRYNRQLVPGHLLQILLQELGLAL